MYVAKGSGLEVYETFDELINKGIFSAWDYHGKYYINLKLDDPYDSRMWVVDKNTKKISDIPYTSFLEFIDKATPIDPEALRRVS